MTIRVLTAGDVRDLLPMSACIDLMAEALAAVSRGGTVMPARFVMPAGANNLMGVMPGYLDAPEGFGVKLVSLFPGNVAAGLSSHSGVVLLFEPLHGRPVALIDAGELTAIRTAAASGLATRLLARENAGDLALLGAGEQAVSHLEAMLAVRPLRRARVWSRDPDRTAAFAKAQGERHGIAIEPMPDARAAIEGADLICTVSGAREPILQGAWIAPGAHLNVVGSSIPSTAEVDVETVSRARLFVDYRDSTLREGGEYRRAIAAGAIGPDHILAEIGELVAGRHPGRESESEITLFKSLGVAAEDLAAAHYLLAAAEAAGSGQVVDF